MLTVQRIITDKTGEALIVACRASGFSVEAFKEIAVSPVTGIASDLNEVVPLTRLYRRLTVANAERAVRYWRTRTLCQRSGQDRRSSLDTRSKEEREQIGERRLGTDRRAAPNFGAI